MTDESEKGCEDFMYQIAAVGDRDSVYGFAALGLDVYPVTDCEAAAKLIRRLAASKTAVIFLTEQLAAQIPEVLADYREAPIPALIPIPGVYGNNGMGMHAVKDAMIKAVGSDIL